MKETPVYTYVTMGLSYKVALLGNVRVTGAGVAVSLLVQEVRNVIALEILLIHRV